MNAGDAGAVVVSFHPDADVLENLRLLREQIAYVVVVDNGSDEASVSALRAAAGVMGFELMENRENLGIAAALNGGIRRVREQGCASVLLFDQDSRVTEGYVETMMRCFAETREVTTRTAILVPRYVDRRFGTVLAPPVGAGGTLEAATTSGSLMPVKIFEDVGWFAEELFIDGVDYEYSLRVRRAGFSIKDCTEAVLLHSPGSPTHHRMLGSKPFQVANYSPVRRYYQERNKIWVTKRYWRTFVGFCARQFLTSAKDLLKIVLVEENKAHKCRYFFLGWFDGLRGRTGRLRDR